MPLCDRCGDEIPIAGTAISEHQNISQELLRELQQPSEDPFTIIEGAFAVWTEEFEIEQQGSFPLLLCRECTEEFVEWVSNPDVVPAEEEIADHSIEWSYTDN